MGKLLKPLVVILLLVNGVAAYLGYMVYEQRTMIKNATLKQSEALATVATNLKNEDMATAARTGLKIPADGSLAAMDDTLGKLTELASLKQSNIEELQNDLASERTLRQQKERELELTKADLEATQGDLEETEGKLATAKAEAADALAKVDGLNGEIATLKSSIEGLESTLATKEDQIIELADNVKVLEKENHELFLDTPAGKEFRPPTPEELRELTGTVIASRPDFNFIVLDLGSEQFMQANFDALIHRGEELIARVRISQVKDNVSIADVVPEWGIKEIAVGDKVIFDIQ